jgi:hypothetical protein
MNENRRFRAQRAVALQCVEVNEAMTHGKQTGIGFEKHINRIKKTCTTVVEYSRSSLELVATMTKSLSTRKSHKTSRKSYKS